MLVRGHARVQVRFFRNAGEGRNRRDIRMHVSALRMLVALHHAVTDGTLWDSTKKMLFHSLFVRGTSCRGSFDLTWTAQKVRSGQITQVMDCTKGTRHTNEVLLVAREGRVVAKAAGTALGSRPLMIIRIIRRDFAIGFARVFQQPVVKRGETSRRGVRSCGAVRSGPQAVPVSPCRCHPGHRRACRPRPAPCSC
jgi:hypothetical protein